MSDDRVFLRCMWRLVPFMMVLYLVNYIDRVNVGFAALTMNRDLGFSATIYGFGAGIFFFSYALCQIPANVIIERVGARRGIGAILLIWGAISAANAFVWDAWSFYVLRFSLGIAEAGFFPGMIFYLTLWFPKAYLARCIGMFQCSNPLAFVVGGPLSGLILGMDGTGGLHGWQWLFLLEGVPACLLAIAVFYFLPNAPHEARWLDKEEQTTIESRLNIEGATAHRDIGAAFKDWRVFALGLAGGGIIFCLSGLQFFAPQIVQGMGFSNLAVGFMVALPFVLATAGMNLWCYLSDVKGERAWHFAFAALFTAMGLVAASVVSSNTVIFVGLSMAIIGVFAALPVLNSLPPSFLRGPAAAGGIALFNTIAQFGAFSGSLVMGYLKDETGGYSAGLLALALAMVMAAVIVLALNRALAPHAVIAKAGNA